MVHILGAYRIPAPNSVHCLAAQRHNRAQTVSPAPDLEVPGKANKYSVAAKSIP